MQELDPALPYRPNIFFLCMHKAASTFVADVLLRSIPERTGAHQLYLVGSFLIQFMEEKRQEGIQPARTPAERAQQLSMLFSELPLPTSNGLIGRLYPGHLKPLQDALDAPLPGEKNKLIIMRRDPRDALVSLYYSMSFSHSEKHVEGDNSGFLANREQLKNQHVRDGLKTVLTKRGLDSTMPEFMRCTEMILTNNNICDLSYELLVTDPYLWLMKFIDFTELSECLDENWLDEMASHLKPPEKENPLAHKRRITPGNWMDVFDDELEQMVKDKLGDRLEQFGYCW